MYLTKLSFKNETEIMTISFKQNLGAFTTYRPALNELLKEVLQKQ